MDSLQGYKTYIVAGLIGLTAVANHFKWIDDDTFKTIIGLLAGTGLATISAKMNRTETKSEAALNGVTYLAGNYTQSKYDMNRAKINPPAERIQGQGIVTSSYNRK
jgi:hypothetical protein